MVGATAWICVLRIGPMMPARPPSLNGFENASTVPGFVLALSRCLYSFHRPAEQPAPC